VFAGNYALNLTNATLGALYQEEDGVGRVNSDGVSTLMGIVDFFSSRGDLFPGSALNGNFAQSSSAPGRLTGAYMLTLNATTTQTLKEIFYVVNADNVLFIESDGAGQTTGILQLQNTNP